MPDTSPTIRSSTRSFAWAGNEGLMPLEGERLALVGPLDHRETDLHDALGRPMESPGGGTRGRAPDHGAPAAPGTRGATSARTQSRNDRIQVVSSRVAPSIRKPGDV